MVFVHRAHSARLIVPSTWAAHTLVMWCNDFGKTVGECTGSTHPIRMHTRDQFHRGCQFARSSSMYFIRKVGIGTEYSEERSNALLECMGLTRAGPPPPQLPTPPMSPLPPLQPPSPPLTPLPPSVPPISPPPSPYQPLTYDLCFT